jgi:hypothetical protein
MGIVPGLTSVQVAISRIIEVFALTNVTTRALPEGMYVFQVPQSQIDIVLFNQTGTITFVQIGADDNQNTIMPTLGEVPTNYGLPVCVNPYESGGRDWTLIYGTPSGVIEFNLPDDESLHFLQSVDSIALHPPITEDYCLHLPRYLGNATRSHYQEVRSTGVR